MHAHARTRTHARTHTHTYELGGIDAAVKNTNSLEISYRTGESWCQFCEGGNRIRVAGCLSMSRLEIVNRTFSCMIWWTVFFPDMTFTVFVLVLISTFLVHSPSFFTTLPFLLIVKFWLTSESHHSLSCCCFANSGVQCYQAVSFNHNIK